jgi:hypothetical protein
LACATLGSREVGAIVGADVSIENSQRDCTDAKTSGGKSMSAQQGTDAEQGAPNTSGNRGRPRVNAFVNWFLVPDELLRARQNVARITGEQREHLRRAKLAFEFGDRALASRGDPGRLGSTAPLAANLFRQSLYWALRSQNPTGAGVEPAEVWARAEHPSLACLAANADELARITTAMRSTFIELAEESPENQRALSALLRRSASRLVTSAEQVPWQLEWSKLKRLTRLVLAVVLCVAPVALLIVLSSAKPDLAKGKHWRTSSSFAECHPESSECGGATTDILFHTKEEKSPWFEYDFGAPLAFSSLTIQNRADYGPERAVPLIVEVSNDDQKFREIARRVDSFSTWKPSFATQHARYLRLRVARFSMLHLEAIKVHP